MGWIIGIIAAGLGLLLGKGSRQSTESLSMSGGYTVETWRPLITVLAEKSNPKLSVPYILKWIQLESGGNPCSIGQKINGPDGYPKELGISQVYNPEDLKRFHITGKELRAYCKPGFSSQVSRPLTQEEMTIQARMTIDLVLHCLTESGRSLIANKIPWSPNSKDFWKAVKLWHALPVIVRPGFANVTKYLGRAPISWTEFRKTYEIIQPRAKFVPGKDKQDGYYRALQISEDTGNAFVGSLIV